MSRQRTRVLTNLRRMNQSSLPDAPLLFSYTDSNSALGGAVKFIAACLRSDVVILETAVERLLLACALKWVLPVFRFRLVSVDLILRIPKSPAGRVKAFLKRLLLMQVDQFMLFFKDLRGCQRLYGIGPDRAIYIPFKVNDWDKMHLWADTTSGGDYVMCAGRTMRDVNTFVEAIRRSGCPGLLHQQQADVMAEHGTQGWKGDLPPNLKLVVDDSYRHEVFLDFIANARLVVIPRFRNDIGPAGIATYLVAMALNKCVIISEGPGVDDVLTDQAVIVSPEDPEALARQIELLWNDHQLRAGIAARGKKYALSLGGEQRMHRDILAASIQRLREPDSSSHANQVRDEATIR
jgi:glycosyltransferase involved in cell wall biosynthesis